MLLLLVHMAEQIRIMKVMNLKDKSMVLIHMIETLEISTKILEEVAHYDHKATLNSIHNRLTLVIKLPWQSQFLVIDSNDSIH